MNKKEQAEDQKPPPDVEDFLPMKLCLRHSERAQVEYDDGQQEKQQPHHHIDGILRR